MKIRAQRKALADTIAWIAQAIPKNAPQPALAGIRLAAADGRLTARSFDYDLSLSATLDVDVASEGECLVSGRFLSWIVGSLKSAEVELVLDGDELTVTSGRSTYRARVLRIDDYPALPSLPAKVGTIDADEFAGMVSAAALFVDNDASLTIIQALHLEGDAGELTAVGLRSSGANIATSTWECTTPFTANPLPRHLDAALRGLSGEVTIGFEGGVLGLADERRTVTLRTLEGEYAKWRNLIREPHEDGFQVTVEVDDLMDAVKRAGALCDDETPLVISLRPGEIEVAIAADERGAGSDVVVAECDGEASIGMHARYLLAALGAMPPGPIQLGVGRPNTHGRDGCLNVRLPDSDARLSLVMPKRLPGGTR